MTLYKIAYMQDTIQSIFSSARQFLSGTLFSRVTGFLRDVATAYAFGASASVAAFMVAFRFSHLLRRILGEGALQGAFTPKFEELRRENPQKAKQFYRDLNALLSLGLILIITLSMFFLGGWYFLGDLSPGNAEIAQLTLLLMPGLFFICLYGLNAALLQCEKKYLLASAVPSLLNLGWILGVFLLSSLPASQAMPWLALFVVAATALQWGATVPSCRDIAGPLTLTFQDTAAVRSLLKPLFLSTIGVAAAQINSALDAVFARYADLEGPAFLWYAIRLQQLPLALFGIAIASAILPPLSRAAREGDKARFDHFSSYARNMTLLLMVPITLGIFLFGGWAVKLIYQHGDFGPFAAQMTLECLQGYAIGLIPMALVICKVQGEYAQGNYAGPMKASLASIGCNVLLSSWFVFGLGWGAVSIAIATGLSAWVNWGVLHFFTTENTEKERGHREADLAQVRHIQ